ncbi:MAG: glycosyltransferase family 4 protein [Candidatus Altiarchaeota archaeon]
MSLRLGYVSQYFTREYRGPVTNLLIELSKKVDVVNYSSKERHAQYYSGGVHAMDSEKIGDHLSLRRYEVGLKLSGVLFPKNLTPLISQDKLDIIQSEEYYQPASHIAFKHARKNGIPFIFNHRGSEERKRTLKERVFFTMANPMSRGLVEGSDAIVCISEAGKKALCVVFPKAQDKVHVIPNSIDPLLFDGANGRSFRYEYRIPEASPLLLCVARLHFQKRIDLLIRTFAEVKKQSPDSVLCVVGPWFDEEKRKVDSLISKLRVDDVVFTGPIPNDNVKDAYAAADVVAMTSEYEPFGYCLLEAMCLSKPVVAFNIGAVPEIIEDGVSGYHIPFADTKGLGMKISTLLNDKKLSKKMGKEGLRRVNEKFSLSDNSKRLIKLYERMVKR